MASLPEYLRQSELLEQIVLDRATMETFGRVEVIWEYPKVHKVLGFICKPGRFDRRKLAFNLDQIQSTGSNGVLVSSAPMETDGDRVSQLESLVNCEVWTDDGNRLGRITDYVFHLETGTIRYYLLSRLGIKGLPTTLYSLYPSQILNVGRNRVLVSAGIANGLEVYQVGLQKKLFQEVTQVSESLRDENGQLNQGLQSLVRRAANKAQRVADRAQDLTEKALDRVQTLGDEFLETEGRSNRGRRDEAYGRYDDGRYDDRGYDDQGSTSQDSERWDTDPRSERRFDPADDFDFEAPWEEFPVQGETPRTPIPTRPRFNPQPKPNSNPEPPPSKRDRSPDPWDDDEVW
jgi:uncharacterized protein YrrD